MEIALCFRGIEAEIKNSPDDIDTLLGPNKVIEKTNTHSRDYEIPCFGVRIPFNKMHIPKNSWETSLSHIRSANQFIERSQDLLYDLR